MASTEDWLSPGHSCSRVCGNAFAICSNTEGCDAAKLPSNDHSTDLG
jgi:hypothetical protein